MSAATARIIAGDRATAGTHAAAEWEQIEQVAPELAVTMRRYLAQAATFLAPRSVDATNGALRQLAAGQHQHRVGHRATAAPLLAGAAFRPPRQETVPRVARPPDNTAFMNADREFIVR